jgi:hypothetical protein
MRRFSVLPGSIGLLFAVVVLTVACGSGSNQPAHDAAIDSPEAGQAGDSMSDSLNVARPLEIDVSKTGIGNAATLFRPGVVGYGMLDRDRKDGYFVLDRYLQATGGRGGYVKIDELSSRLRRLDNTSNLSQQLRDVDEAIARVVKGGGRVQLNIYCMLPQALSTLQGYEHDVVTGKPGPSGAPIYACAPLKEGQETRQKWHEIMRATAAHFKKYSDKIVYVIGNEPESYFAGDETQLFELFDVTATGLRAGDPNARLGGIIPSSTMLANLGHTQPTFDAKTSSFSFTKKTLSAPLVKLWLEHLDAKNIPIDVVQVKGFSANPVPVQSAFWVPVHQQVEKWLGENPRAHKGKVELVFSDFPGWHTVCAEDVTGKRESIWDSEYFAAWYTATYIGVKRYIARQSGIIDNIEPLLGYLIEYGTPAFFHTSCEPDQSRPAGFGGAMGLYTATSKLPKPILHSLSLLTSLDGKLLSIEQPDPNLQVIASVSGKTVRLLVSHFVPSEYNTAGFVGYDWGTLFSHNDYGRGIESIDRRQLGIALPPQVRAYLTAPDFPKGLIHDLLAVPDVIDIDALSLPAPLAAFLAATRAAGRQNRKTRAASEQGKHKQLDIRFLGLDKGQYRSSSQVIDVSHGNAYTDRLDLHRQLEAAQQSGGKAAVEKLLETMRKNYGLLSTHDRDELLDSQSTVRLSLRPNSVHLVVLKPVN